MTTPKRVKAHLSVIFPILLTRVELTNLMAASNLKLFVQIRSVLYFLRDPNYPSLVLEKDQFLP